MKDKQISLLTTGPLGDTLINKALRHDVKIDSILSIKTEIIIDSSISKEIKELAAQQITAVFTSTNGVEAVIDRLAKNAIQPAWNIYCIGAATQTLIRDYFIKSHIAGTGKNAAELSETIINGKATEVVFFCGNQRRDELPQQLQKKNIGVKEIVVYETSEIPVKVDREYNGILFFSPSAVKSFFSVNCIPSDTVLFSIGNTTADAIRKSSDNDIIVSDFPSKDALIEIAIKHFNK